MIRIESSPRLSSLTTLGVGGTALASVQVEEPMDFDKLPAVLAQTGGTPVVLGGGSNLLVAEGELPLTLIRPMTGATDKPLMLGETEEGLLIRVGAGLPLPRLVSWCSEHGLSGLEGLAGLPGRVGGAVAMNAGAYGCSFAPLLRELTVFTPEDGLQRLGSDDWTASYRHFSLNAPHAWFVAVEAVLALPRRTPDQVRATVQSNLAAKKSTQPLGLRTAGCVFKNPEGHSAGRLLDEAGMRGRREGVMFFTEKHANFLARDSHIDENVSGAFAAAATLVAEAREAVARRTGIILEMEIKVWPCPLS